MFCYNCGKNLEDNSKFCIYCGKSLLPEDNTIINKNKNSNKKIICIIVAGIIALVAAISIIIGIFVFKDSKLTKDERFVYENCKYLKSLMRDPDSFKLYDSIVLLKHYDDRGNNDYTYTIFKYGGTNGYGAVTTDEAIFKGNKYIMNYSDELDEDDYDYETKRKIKLELLELEFEIDYMETEPTQYKIINVDVKKIKKKLGLK